MENRYILRKGDYYLCNISKTENFDNQVIIENFELDRDYRKLYSDYEVAEEDRKLIYIETGLNLEIKIFKKEEENED